jgi:hypothetical protein
MPRRRHSPSTIGRDYGLQHVKGFLLPVDLPCVFIVADDFDKAAVGLGAIRVS